MICGHSYFSWPNPEKDMYITQIKTNKGAGQLTQRLASMQQRVNPINRLMLFHPDRTELFF